MPLADSNSAPARSAQVAGIELDNAAVASVVAAVGSAHRPVQLDRARLERQKRELALDHAAETISDDIYLERLARIRNDITSLENASRPGVSAERAVEWLRALADNVACRRRR